MIFIGPKLSNPDSHFRMNIVDSIGTSNDLLIDLCHHRKEENIFDKIDEFLEKHSNERIVVYNPFIDDDFFFNFHERFPELSLVTFFSDDEWRCFNYDRYIALFSDVYAITDRHHLKLYEQWGFTNCVYTPWACNPKKFYRIGLCTKRYDVTFIGAAYGKRVEYIQYLAANGINIKLFGSGWERFSELNKHHGGYVSSSDLVQIINESKINLNFLWTSFDEEVFAVKGRTFELAGCCAFQLCNSFKGVYEFFKDGIEVDTFRSKEELLEKVVYYLKNEEKREEIAKRAYETIKKNHTWKNRFNAIFSVLESNSAKRRRFKARIIVLTQGRIEDYDIPSSDENIHIEVQRVEYGSANMSDKYDGVLILENPIQISARKLYMWTFGLAIGTNEFVVANFYTKDLDNNVWIRFTEKDISGENHKEIRNLPLESILFRNVEAYEKFKRGEIGTTEFSVIEYPVFLAKGLSRRKTRKLRIKFGYYDRQHHLSQSLRRFKLFRVIGIIRDIFLQKGFSLIIRYFVACLRLV